ncbi:hypothetical protein HNV12_01300 [Methanococcoides sp. SA1]|nr:hypothetical protein [Methanococcoides sp. SA1]
MKKVLISLVAVFLVFLGFGYYFLFSSSVVEAQLYVKSGEVFVNGDIVSSVVGLSEGDVVLTGIDGVATIILYDSVVIDLEGDTEISLDELVLEHPKVSQKGGETWNTFTKLSGVQAYSLKNGNAIASVRGTSFGIRDGYILGGEGEISYVVDGEEFFVGRGEVVEVVGSEVIEREANVEELSEIMDRLEVSVEELRGLREEVLEDNEMLINLAKEKTGFSDEELEDYLRQADEGEIDVDELVSMSPIEVDAISRIADITKAISKIKKEISLLNG